MKSRTFASILILILVVFVIIGSCATKRKAVSDEDFFKVLNGTWINTDYSGGELGQKIINHPDGTREGFGVLSSTTSQYKFKTTILDQWLDSTGTIWYKGQFETIFPTRAKGYEMGKINNAGNTWECILSSENYPIEEWEPDRFEYNYFIYYRKE